MQSRSQHGHQEAVVNVTQQLGFNGGMSNLKKMRVRVSPSLIRCFGEELSPYLGDSAAEVEGVQEVHQSRNLRI